MMRANTVILVDRPNTEKADCDATVHWGPLSSALKAEWRSLAGDVADGDFFQRPEVFDAWRTELSNGAQCGILLVRKSERPVGLMTVMRCHGLRPANLRVHYDYDPADATFLTKPGIRLLPVRQFGPILSLPATMLGPVCSISESRPEVISAFCRAFAQEKPWDMSVFPMQESDLPLWHKGLHAVGLRHDVQSLDRTAIVLDPVVPLPDLIAMQSKKRRQNFRRAVASGDRIGLTVRRCRDVSDIVPLLTRLAQESWKTTGRAGENVLVRYDGRQRRFFETLFLGPDRDRTVATIASLPDRDIAILVGCVIGNRLTTLLTFWDGTHPESSPGIRIIADMIDWAADQGLTTVDFNSGAPWLRMFRGTTTTTQQNLVIYGRGVRPTALRLWRASGRSLKSMWRDGRPDSR